MSNPHCIACEQLDDWIEIDIRDERNQAFSGITAFVTDMVGNKQELMLSGDPQLVTRLAPGAVTLTLDTEPWLAVSMARKPLLGEASVLLDYTAQKKGFSDTPKTYLHMTSGDLVTQMSTTMIMVMLSCTLTLSGSDKWCISPPTRVMSFAIISP